jgi:hypothetical protein
MLVYQRVLDNSHMKCHNMFMLAYIIKNSYVMWLTLELHHIT